MYSVGISEIIFLIVSSVCAVTDTGRRHIDNRVLLAGAVMTALSFAVRAPHIEMRALVLMLLFVCVLFFTFMLGLMGGGDVKLYALLVFSAPDERGLNIMILSVVLAAVYGVICIIADGKKRGIPMALFIFMAALVIAIKGGGIKWTE